MELNEDYLKYLLKLTEDDAQQEIRFLCKSLWFDPEYYTISISAGGFGYVLEKIASDLFMTFRVIDEGIRHKLLLFWIVVETSYKHSNVFSINEDLKKVNKDRWVHSSAIENQAALEKLIREKIGKMMRNCFTCADQKSGCQGEDSDCCNPDYKDWRPPK